MAVPGERAKAKALGLAHYFTGRPCKNGHIEDSQLVIAADGLRSRMRAVLNGDQAPFFTRQVAWRAIVPSTTELHRVVTVHMGPGRHIVSYPLRGGAMANIVAVQERADWADEGWHRESQSVIERAPSTRGQLSCNR